MCTLSCEIWPHEQKFDRKTLIRIFEHNFGLWPSVWHSSSLDTDRARRARFFFSRFGRPPNPLNYLKCLLTWLCQMESRCKKILFCIHIFEPYLILARLANAVSSRNSIGLAKKEARNAEKKLNRFGHQRIYHNPKWKGMHHYNSSVQKSSVIWAQCTAAHARTRHSRAVT